MEFPAKLRRLMHDRRFSQDMLARKLDVSQNLVSLWARGKSVPDLFESRRIARLFDVPLDFLADDDQDEPPPASMSDRERQVWELVRTIGAEEAYWRLVGAAGIRPPEGEAAQDRAAEARRKGEGRAS